MSFSEEGTLFGRIPEKNVYFLIDTSGSMYHQLGFVKEHLLEVLSNRASILNDSMFNLIEFKNDIDKWADKLVHCTPTTVNLAARWINQLVCGTSTNTLGALMEAFNDNSSEAVYMVTDGLPDQRPAVILEKLKSLRQKVPVHSIYLNGAYSDSTTHDFLRDLAEQTEGSFRIITLSHGGSVQKVIPIYNSKSSYFQHYGGNGCAFVDTKSCHDNILVPQNSVYNNQMSSCSKYTDNSKILNYADAVIKASGLAQSAGVRCSSTPVACSLMKGMKVLARRDQDGLYYLGEVIQQGLSETFIVKFDSYHTMRKPIIQETSVQNMIAYKDAMRASVSLGDSVLAPWKQDGCYGPGTVLDDYFGKGDIQSAQKRGPVLVTFFNGETVELQPDIAVRISKQTFNRVVRELQLPESQRRKLLYPERNIPPTFDSQTEKRKWETGHECPPAVLCTRAWTEKRDDQKMRKRINDQIRENNYLLHALDLNNGLPESRVLGKATTSELRGYDSGVFSENSSEASDDDSKMTYNDSFRFDFSTQDKEYDLEVSSSFPQPKATALSTSGGNTVTKKRWRYWNTGVPAKQPRFRDTLLKKPREAGEKSTNASRPGHEEYQTIAGISFPAGTDRKFDQKPQLWHPYRQFVDPPKGNRSAVSQSSHLKHSEYQDASGVGFPSATDRKFKRIIDPNWRPETAIQNAERARYLEAGPGYACEMENDAKCADKFQKIRSNQGKYFEEIEDKVAVEEKKEVKRIEFRRNKMTERQENLAETVAEKNRLMTTRMNNRKERQAAIQRNEKQRTDNAEKWKHDRIEVRRDRLAEYTEMEGNLEREKEKRVVLREVRRRTREYERREEFHQKLREEWKNEDERAEFLQRKHELNQERAYKRQQDGERRKEARFAAKQEKMERYRASILP